jgi:hypothetical protein
MRLLSYSQQHLSPEELQVHRFDIIGDDFFLLAILNLPPFHALPVNES